MKDYIRKGILLHLGEARGKIKKLMKEALAHGNTDMWNELNEDQLEIKKFMNSLYGEQTSPPFDADTLGMAVCQIKQTMGHVDRIYGEGIAKAAIEEILKEYEIFITKDKFDTNIIKDTSESYEELIKKAIDEYDATLAQRMIKSGFITKERLNCMSGLIKFD